MTNREKWLDENKEWTVSEFHAWREENVSELEEAQKSHQLAVDSIVIKEVMGMLKKGITLDIADKLLMRNKDFFGVHNGVIVTEEAARRSLTSFVNLANNINSKQVAR